MTAPQKITLGAVSYLNSLPLLENLSFPIKKEVPSKLLSIFNNGEVDAALLSAYDILQMPHAEIVDNIAIGCRGAVYSVILAYEGKLRDLKKIRLDPSSHTSNNLLKIILAEFHGLFPEYLEAESSSEVTLPRLIIGDPAISFRKNTNASILDLGEEWMKFTKLPFIFAMWCLNNESTQKEFLIKALQTAKKEGMLQRKAIATAQPDPKFAERYLTEYIRYDLGAEERRGLELFKLLLEKHHLMQSSKNSFKD